MEGPWKHNPWYSFFRPYVDACIRFCFRRVKVQGLKNIPEDGAVIIAPNHCNTLMDALVVLRSRRSSTVFGARADIFENPTAATVLRFLRILPMVRRRDGIRKVLRNYETIEQVVDVLRNGVPFCMFAEGTHSTKHSLLPINKGVFRIAVAAHNSLNVPSSLASTPCGVSTVPDPDAIPAASARDFSVASPADSAVPSTSAADGSDRTAVSALAVSAPSSISTASDPTTPATNATHQASSASSLSSCTSNNPCSPSASRVSNEDSTPGKDVYIVPAGIEYGDYFHFGTWSRLRYGKAINVSEFIRQNPSLNENELVAVLRERLVSGIRSRIVYFSNDDNYYSNWAEFQKRYYSLYGCLPSEAGLPKKRLTKIVLALLLAAPFALSAILTLPMWGIAEFLCSKKVKDRAFHNTVRFALKVLGTIIFGIAWGIAFFSLLPWWLALILLLYFFASYSIFYFYLNLLRASFVKA